MLLSKLINKKFNCISRAIDMLCLFIGEDYTFVSERGKNIDVAEYSLHFQTQWRFREKETILLASRDIYIPYNEDVPDDWDFDVIGRPDDLSSIFDVQKKFVEQKMQGAYVSKCYLTESKDLVVEFSNGIIFEQFTPTSKSDEEWRLIDYKLNQHEVF